MKDVQQNNPEYISHDTLGKAWFKNTKSGGPDYYVKDKDSKGHSVRLNPPPHLYITPQKS